MRQEAIRDALLKLGCMCWRQPNVPVPIFRGTGKHRVFEGFRKSVTVGLPDLGGITPGGRALAIEVKSAEKEHPTPEQVKWLDAIAHQGGIAMVARTVDDVVKLYAEVKEAGGWLDVESPWPGRK